MYCTPRTQIPRISWLHKITDSCERLFQRFGIGSDGSGYPFEKQSHPFERLTGYPFEKNCHPIELLGLFVRERNVIPSGTSDAIRSRKSVIRSNGSGYPFEENVIRSNVWSYSFERLELSAQNNCQPRYCSKSLSPEPFTTNLSRNHVNLNNSCKLRLLSSYEFLRYVFCWIAFFAFITFDFRCKFH